MQDNSENDDIQFIKDTSIAKTEIQQNIDLDKVELIVSRIKQKYEKEGLLDKVESSKLGELRSLIAEGKRGKIEVMTPSDLRDSYNPYVKSLGNIYLSLQKLFKVFADRLFNYIPGRKTLAYELYSANINYSTSQYLAISSVISVLSTIFVGVLLFCMFFILDVSLIYALFLTAGFFLAISILAIRYPAIIANSRAKSIERELPFALRHMATELRAGVGLYRVLQSIAISDYGIFSEELAKTIAEVEEGADTQDALKNLSLRTKSFALKNAINHLLRALKTGGNLSEVMNSIADEVSFELRIEIESFAEKMNFFGVIYIFAGIVVPVMIAVLGGIRNAPLGTGLSFFSALPLTPLIITVLYVVLLPLVLFALVYYIKTIRPTM